MSQALESERVRLAHAIYYGTDLGVAARDFGTPATRSAAAAITELRAEGAPIEKSVVQARLRESAREFTSEGGPDAFVEALAEYATTANLDWHSAQVRRAALRRRLDDVLRRRRTDLRVDDDALDLLQRTQHELDVLAREGVAGDRGQFAWLLDAWKTISERGGGWLSAAPPPREYLLRLGGAHGPGLLPCGRVGMAFAAGGAGKTMMMAAFAAGVASGQPALGAFHVDRPGNVLLALAEEDEAEMRRRLFHAAAVAKLDADARELVEQRIVTLPLIGRDVSCNTAVLAGGNRTTTPFVEALASQLRDREWSLLIFDPLSRFGGPDVEKDSAAATFFVQTLERFAEAPGRPSVLICHHQPKVRIGEARTARGSSGLRDGVRWEVSIEGRAKMVNAPRLVDLHFSKANYGPEPNDVVLARDAYHEGALRIATPHEVKAYADACKDSGNEPPPARSDWTS